MRRTSSIHTYFNSMPSLRLSRLLPLAAFRRAGVPDLICARPSNQQGTVIGILDLIHPQKILDRLSGLSVLAAPNLTRHLDMASAFHPTKQGAGLEPASLT